MSVGHNVEGMPALLKRIIASVEPAPTGPTQDPVEQLIFSLLVWECSTAKAELAWKRVQSAVVDHNELRVALPQEVREMLGERYPRVDDRIKLIRTVLHSIYLREHAVSLDHLKGAPKRDARKYLDSLEGIPPFVASRVMLLSLGGHAAPLDQQLLDLLIAEEIFEAGTDLEKAAGILDRYVKASEGQDVYLLLEAWSDDPAAIAKGGRKSKSKTKRPRKARAAAGEAD
ncbi:MAG: hypothetical protein VYC34_03800 [Planctomycetota bacterium]|nr:hypothetical protein [Planctomycetota bacterium]